MEKKMKNYLFATAMFVLSCVGTNASFADTAKESCTKCTAENPDAIQDCINNYLLGVAECTNIVCPKCPIPTTSKLLK